MNVFKSSDGFKFHNNQLFHHKVKPVFADQFAAIAHRKRFLAFIPEMPVFEFDAKRIFVSGFNVTRAEVPKNLNCRTNNLSR